MLSIRSGVLESLDPGPGPWTRKTLDSGPILRSKNTKKYITLDAADFVCFWIDISGNIGPGSSISESKVQAQGPAIPECPAGRGGNIGYS